MPDGRTQTTEEGPHERPLSHNGHRDAPEGNGDIPVGGWFAVLKRTVAEFRADNVTDWAAALLAMAMLMLGILYYWAPNVRQPKFRWITPGSVLAVVVWIIASAAFALYVANFGSYDKTYGSLGGVVIGLIWLWISNIAVLLGQELNAELERERELQAGNDRAQHEIQLEPRGAPAD